MAGFFLAGLFTKDPRLVFCTDTMFCTDGLYRVLYEELPNVYVFSAHTMFTTFCAPFRNRISHFKILVMP